jgi:hypothetical protein
MSTSRQSVPQILVAVAAVMVLLGTLWFSSLQPGYSQITNTISELGELGAVHPHLVAYGFFLPVGLMVWLALWLLHREADGKEVSRVLLALSCLGTGYVASARWRTTPRDWPTMEARQLASCSLLGGSQGVEHKLKPLPSQSVARSVCSA